MSEPSSRSSVTQWLRDVRAGHDVEAMRRLHQRYCDLLVPVAQKRLRSLRRLDDAEVRDAVDSALGVCFRKLREGSYPGLRDRNDLWRLLTTITARKANDLHKRRTALKEGADRVLGESALRPAGADSSAPGGLDALPAPGPTPDEEAAWKETCQLLLDRLEDPRHIEVVLLRMQGETIPEIVAATGHSRASVDRWLKYARAILHDILPDS